MPAASAIRTLVVDDQLTMRSLVRASLQQIGVRDIGLLEGRYYLRFTTQDKPGVLGHICTILGRHGVSISSCHQFGRPGETPQGPVHVVVMTHETVESSVMQALNEIDALDTTAENTHVLRVL